MRICAHAYFRYIFKFDCLIMQFHTTTPIKACSFVSSKHQRPNLYWQITFLNADTISSIIGFYTDWVIGQTALVIRSEASGRYLSSKDGHKIFGRPQPHFGHRTERPGRLEAKTGWHRLHVCSGNCYGSILITELQSPCIWANNHNTGVPHTDTLLTCYSSAFAHRTSLNCYQ